MDNNKNFYGKWIIIGGMIITGFTTATVNNTMALYMPAVCGEFGFTVTQFSGTFGLGSLGAALGIILAGKLLAKLSIKSVMVIGIAGCCLSFLGFSSAKSLLMFYITIFGIDLFVNFITNVPLTTMINNWYTDKRGSVTGLVFAGGGVGAIVLPVIWNMMLLNPAIGWRKAALISAIVIAVTALPVSLFIMSPAPAAKNQKPYTYPEGSPEAIKAAKEAEASGLAASMGVSKGDAVKSASFLFLAIGMLCMGIIAGGVMTHIPNFLNMLGLGAQTGLTLAIAGVGMLLGTVLIGILFDKIGLVKGMFLTALLFAIGLVCLLFTGPKTVFLALVAGGTIGFAACVSQIAPPLFVSRIFGMKAYADIFSLNYAIFMVGCIIGAPALGVLCDMTKSYNLAWIVSIILAALLFLSFFFGIKSGAKLSEKQQAAE